MAPDERDRSFDKALARHLRAESSLQDSANSPSRGFGAAGECPDPETLAAYHERSLLPEEMNSWKEHIVGCANCQTILSHLEATDAIPLQTTDAARVLAQQESAHQVAASASATLPFLQFFPGNPAAHVSCGARVGNGSLPPELSPPACSSGSHCMRSSR